MYSRLLIIFVLVTTGTSYSLAQTADWNQLASGNHSFKSLGKEFYVDVPVRKIPDDEIELAFVNRALFKSLGLELPTDPVATKNFLVNLFGWEVDPTGKSEKKWFATHYLDASKKGPGQAVGDGRALWTGELAIKSADGKINYIDAVEKGVGVTPFAWLKNKSHSDGKQTASELAYSALQSIAGQKNQLDTTSDAVGFIIRRNGEVKTQTLRLGRQTRPAHIAYFLDDSILERRLMDYIIRRDLGLSLSAPVTDAHFEKWELQFTRNNAEEAARFFDLLAIQESPTKGNKTTTGGSIDLAGVRYLDAYHVNYRYLFGRISVGEQIGRQKNYITNINRWLSAAAYRTASAELTLKMKSEFDDIFKRTVTELALYRLGLSETQVRLMVATRPEIARSFVASVNELKLATNTNVSAGLQPGNGDGVAPAAFDTRKILAGTVEALVESNAKLKKERMEQLFVVNRAWAGKNSAAHEDLKNGFLLQAKRVLQVLIDTRSARAPELIANAKRIQGVIREDQSGYEYYHKHDEKIVDMIYKGVPWMEITKAIETAADALVDPGLPDRRIVATLNLEGQSHTSKALACGDIYSTP